MKKSAQRLVSNPIYIVLAVGSFFLLLGGLVFPLQPVGYALKTWQVEQDGRRQEVTMPWITKAEPGLSTILLQTSFPSMQADCLVIPRPSGNAVKVRLNGETIYSLGDFSEPTANLWNSVQIVKIPLPLPAENFLEMELVSSYYSSGLNAVPYLTSYPTAAARVGLLNWLYNDLLFIVSGAAVILGLILIFQAYHRRSGSSSELLMGLALLFSFFYLQDMQFRMITGSLTTFLWAKKGIMISGYLGSLFFLGGLEKYYRNSLKYSRWMALLTGIIVLVILGMPSLYALANVLNYTNIVLILNLIIMIVLLLRVEKGPRVMLIPTTWMILAVLQMVAAIPLGLTWPLMTPYTITIATVFMGFKLVMEYNTLFLENIDLNQMKHIDPLTGVKNRWFLSNIEENLNDYLVMIDLDFFKDINDHYGHAHGDQLLIQFAKVARQNLRQNDLVVRYGGDEFVLLLENRGKGEFGFDAVRRIIERIQAEYDELEKDKNLTFSYGIAQLDGSIEKTLDVADQRMYRMKDIRKNGQET